jgi:hypothetical protein
MDVVQNQTEVVVELLVGLCEKHHKKGWIL